MGKRKYHVDDYRIMNNTTWIGWFNRLYGVAINSFEWRNMPKTVNTRYLERVLFWCGMAVIFEDKQIGLIGLQAEATSPLDIYGYPTIRFGISENGYRSELLNDSNSVLVYNNATHLPDVDQIMLFAQRLYEVERAIDVNIKGQKTPGLLMCDENHRLSVLNAYKQRDENAPVIYANKDFPTSSLSYVSTTAPYLVDKLQQQKGKYYSEALTYLGYESNISDKRERVLLSEVMTNLGVTESNRLNRLIARQEACDKLNEMLDLSEDNKIEVRFRSDLQLSQISENLEKVMKAIDKGEIELNEDGEIIEQVYN